MTRQESLEMAKYIVQILQSNGSVVMSWGLCNPNVVDGGLAFHVNGFKYCGWCSVTYDEGSDTFTFRMLTQEGQVKKEVDDVYMDNLVEVIDYYVETGGDSQEQYRLNVDNWLEAKYS